MFKCACFDITVCKISGMAGAPQNWFNHTAGPHLHSRVQCPSIVGNFAISDVNLFVSFVHFACYCVAVYSWPFFSAAIFLHLFDNECCRAQVLYHFMTILHKEFLIQNFMGILFSNFEKLLIMLIFVLPARKL